MAGLRYLEHAGGFPSFASRSTSASGYCAARRISSYRSSFTCLYRGAKRKRWPDRGWGSRSTIGCLRIARCRATRCCRAPRCSNGCLGSTRRGLVGGASYYDAQARFPERLVVENVRDAVANGGASEDLHAGACGLRVCSGPRHGGSSGAGAQGATGAAAAPLVVNAAGPWVDEVLGPIKHTRLIGGTKGSHLIAPSFPGAPRAGVYVEAGSDSRPLFILPWNDLLLVGTTDERFDGDAGSAAIDDRELASLVRETERVFPGRSRPRGSAFCTRTRACGRSVPAARRRGRDHAPASDPPPSCRARSLFDRRRQANDASRARGGRAEGALA